MTTDKQIEQEIQDKGLVAPRITPEHIADLLAHSIAAYHVFEGSQLTICCITLPNGFTITGNSACASPENFDKDIGQKLAYEEASNKVWGLEGYLLKQRLYLLSS